MKTEKTKNVLLAVSAALTLIICGVMNLYLIPLIERTTNGIRMFDMQSFGYTYDTAKEFVRLLSAEGLDTFLHRQLPLDFFYPVAYGAFFMLALNKLTPDKKGLLILPAALMLCDYAENVCSIVMLTTDFSAAAAHAGCAFTVAKTLLMYAVIILPVILVIHKIRKGRKTV